MRVLYLIWQGLKLAQFVKLFKQDPQLAAALAL